MDGNRKRIASKYLCETLSKAFYMIKIKVKVSSKPLRQNAQDSVRKAIESLVDLV